MIVDTEHEHFLSFQRIRKSDNRQVPGTVTSAADTPRSYFVDVPTGTLQRNRGDLNIRPNDSDTGEPTCQTSRSPILTRSKTGIQIRPPNRL